MDVDDERVRHRHRMRSGGVHGLQDGCRHHRGATYRPAPGEERNRHNRTGEADVLAGMHLDHSPCPGRIIDNVQRAQLIVVPHRPPFGGSDRGQT